MSIDVWVPAPGMSPIEFVGHLEFRDMHIPKPGKDEWGIDTLDRYVRGPGSKFSVYCDALKQGDIFGKHFFLQTWKPIDHPILPGVMLSYKGLIGNALPDPLPITTRSELSSSQSAINLSISAPSEDDEDRTIVAADKTIRYVAPTTTWRYITRGEPTGKRFGGPGSIRGVMGIENLGSRTNVTYSDGSTEQYAGSAPAGVATALFANPYIFVVGPSFAPIWGTPFFECEEVCQYKYPDT